MTSDEMKAGRVYATVDEMPARVDRYGMNRPAYLRGRLLVCCDTRDGRRFVNVMNERTRSADDKGRASMAQWFAEWDAEVITRED
jgi:hypothetical protein